MCIFLSGGKVYWVGLEVAYSMNLDGTNIQKLSSNLSELYLVYAKIAVFDDYLYFADLK